MIRLQPLGDGRYLLVRESGLASGGDATIVGFDEMQPELQSAITRLRAGVKAEFGEYRSDEDVYLLSETWVTPPPGVVGPTRDAMATNDETSGSPRHEMPGSWSRPALRTGTLGD